ncbi:TPA: tail fiber domain-containing protein [Escherichia coli]|nr:tail fiber domain-containing protein [Escherichia coli]
MPPIDDRTPKLDLPLPAQPNTLKNDVQRLRDTITSLDDKVVVIDPTTGKMDSKFLPDKVAVLVPPHATLDPAMLPPEVVTVDATGKIPEDKIPDDARTNIHDVASEVLMLELDASIGDVARVTGSGKTYMLMGRSTGLTAPQKTDRGDWKEQSVTAVTSVNGRTGDVVVAEPGVNADITQLTALSGPLTLGGDGTGDGDAVTMRQLKGAMGTSGGASMSGVMNNFIGAVEWFNGPRGALPAGYIAADGQLESRTDPKTADLWTAVSKNMLTSIDDAKWTAGIAERGKYSLGDGSTNFRVPDLNGIQRKGINGFTGIDSLSGLFLRGDGNSASNGGVGTVHDNAAPNILGTLSHNYSNTTAIWDGGNGPFSIIAPSVNQLKSFGSQTDAVNGYRNSILQFNAHDAHAAYGRDNSQEVRPNQVVGIWIIRANGSFQAANSKFEVINAYNPMPAVGQSITGGFVQGSLQDQNGQTVNAVGMTVNNTVGGKPVGVFGVGNWVKNPTTNAYDLSWKHMDLDWDSGYLTLPSGVYIKNNVVVSGNDYPTIRFQDSTNTLLGSIYGEYRGSIKDPNNAQYRKDVTIATGGAVPKYFVHGGDGSMTIPGRCDVSGDLTGARVFSGGALVQTSDRELKDNIEPIADALDKIDRLSGYTYILKADGSASAGVIAQELQGVLPEAVLTHPNDEHLGVAYSGVTALLIEAVKALKAQNADLQAQIDELKAKP